MALARRSLPDLFAVIHPQPQPRAIMECPFDFGSACPFGSCAIPAALPVGHPPLPIGHPPLPQPPPLRTFTLESLASEVKSRCVAVKGAVYDVTTDPRFEAEGVWHEAVGRDLTRTLAFTPLAQGQTQPASSAATAAAAASALHLEAEHQGARALEGLNFDELRLLETWAKHFEACESFRLIGRLLTEHEQTGDMAKAQTSQLSLPGEAHLHPLPSDIYGSFLPLVETATGSSSVTDSNGRSLHALMDADEHDECVRRIEALAQSSPQLNAPCLRSEMTLLHKAVEKGQLQQRCIVDVRFKNSVGLFELTLSCAFHLSVILPCTGWVEAVRALVSRGADVSVPCSLYDGESALQMARRFHSHDCVAALQQ